MSTLSRLLARVAELEELKSEKQKVYRDKDEPIYRKRVKLLSAAADDFTKELTALAKKHLVPEAAKEFLERNRIESLDFYRDFTVSRTSEYLELEQESKKLHKEIETELLPITTEIAERELDIAILRVNMGRHELCEELAKDFSDEPILKGVKELIELREDLPVSALEFAGKVAKPISHFAEKTNKMGTPGAYKD